MSQSERLRELLAQETPPALEVRRLASRIEQDRKLLRATLAMLKAEGKTICGFGAPAQLTTTCYALGITREDIAFIVDENPLKVGKFSPGLNIPIVGPAFLYGGTLKHIGGSIPYRAPDACVIFSANFAKDIMKRHAGFTGDWIEL